MKTFAIFLLLTFLSFAVLANAQCGSCILFYGGDFDPNNPNADGLSNETDAIVGGTPYGAATYQNFTATDYELTNLFTNNLSQLNPQSAYWELRTGISEGNGGTPIASGTASGSNFSHTSTGRSGFGFDEYTDMVSGLLIGLNLNTTYWFAVVPNDPSNAGRSFNSNTFGLNAVGTQTSDQQYYNSPFFGANFTNADNEGPFSTFSSGVLDIWIPEPSSLILLGSGLLAGAGVARRRINR